MSRQESCAQVRATRWRIRRVNKNKLRRNFGSTLILQLSVNFVELGRSCTGYLDIKTGPSMSLVHAELSLKKDSLQDRGIFNYLNVLSLFALNFYFQFL